MTLLMMLKRKPKTAANVPVRPRRWRRAMLVTLALPPLVIGGFGLTTAYRIYASNRALADHKRFPVMPTPKAAQRLLVFAPHCDDEALGASGLMRQASKAGADVQVVIITNGDGFRVGVERDFRELSVGPKDFIRYAYARQNESRAAMRVLGVPSDHITFLGYPDRGLMPMWTTNWSAQMPFRSYYTLSDHSPYDDAPTPHAPYAGETLLNDIETQMKANKPTDVFVTHPSDDHPDHSAAGVFVETALADLKAQGLPWAQTCRLHFYLVHRGDWPVPQGLHENAALPPPAQMADLDTHWEELPLSHRDVEAKYAAIKRYPSQTEVSGRFLFSFARVNELFGTLTPQSAGLTRVPDGRMHADGSPRDWAGQMPVSLDPAGDTVMGAFQSSADITRLFACRDSQNVYVRMDAHQHLSTRVAYSITLRPVLPGSSQPKPLTLSIVPGAEGHPQPVPGVPGAVASWHGSLLEISVPLAQAGLADTVAHENLYVEGETRFAGIVIDHTGFRPVACGPEVHPTQTASR
jgi:LmbE family N-acetylglucosaminyl deacetylase